MASAAAPSSSGAATRTQPLGPPRALARPGRRRWSPVPRPSTGDAVTDARVADPAYLVRQLRVVHPNEFLDEGEATFMARVAAIEDQAGSLSDVGFSSLRSWT